MMSFLISNWNSTTVNAITTGPTTSNFTALSNISATTATTITTLESWGNNDTLIGETLLNATTTIQIVLASITKNLSTPATLPNAPTFTRSAFLRVCVLTVMGVVSLLGNTITIWNIRQNQMSRRFSRHNWSAIYFLILHLSIADLLVTGFCIFGEAGWSYTVQWVASEWTCKFVKFFQMFSLYLSTYVLVLIGIDRWVAVKYPMKSLNMAKRCHRLLLGAYGFSLLLSIPQGLIFHIAKGPFIEEFYQCVTYNSYTAQWQEQLYTTFTLIFMFIIPLGILIGTYMSTFKTISGSEKIFQVNVTNSIADQRHRIQNNRQRLIHRAKMKSLRISVAIVTAFIICWTPYYMMMIIFIFLNPDDMLSQDLQSGIFFFGMSNSLINPLIYGAFHLWPVRKRHRGSSRHSITKDGSTCQKTTTMALQDVKFIRKASAIKRGSKDNESLLSKSEKSPENNSTPIGKHCTTLAVLNSDRIRVNCIPPSSGNSIANNFYLTYPKKVQNQDKFNGI